MSGIPIWITIGAVTLMMLWGIDRLALWAESRGWIYYRRTKRQTGANLGDAFLEIQSMLEPEKRHLLEIRREQESDSSEAADPPHPKQ